MTDLFCYDDGQSGKCVIDGYHWEAEFFIKQELIKKAEGWPGENSWRLKEINHIIGLLENIIFKDLGGGLMPGS